MTKIRIAHSPDADDAFMFYPLLQGKIDPDGIEFEEAREDIESLNQKALQGTYEVTAVSFHAYPYLADKYFLLSTGACFGEGYGPIVVARKTLKPSQLLKVRMGIPGKLTSAFLVLKLYEHYVAGEGKSGICYSQVPFDQIMNQVKEGKIDAGLIIHEGQLSFADQGLTKVVDLGEWWSKETDLPLPLGGIAIRRDLGPEVIRRVAELIQKSIRYSLENKAEALAHALPFARGLDAEKALKFIEMYVNDLTIDIGRKGYKAIKVLLDRGYRAGILSQQVDLEECVFDVKKGHVRVEATAAPVLAAEPTAETPVEVPAESEPQAATDSTPEESTTKLDNPDHPEGN